MRIAVDAFGGDHAPLEIVKGAVDAANQMSDVEVILVGCEHIINEILATQAVPEGRVTVQHAETVIETGDVPVEAIRTKKDSSLMVALSLVKNGEADAVVSAGNTGAYLAGAFRTLGRIKGVKRPALTTILPTVGEPGLILDIGANADCRPEHLVQFAQMGSVYASHVLHIEKPRVALLNIGVEEAKGNALTKETYQQLKNEPIHFVGNIEPREILSGKVDVVICDGFTGNVVIKLIEGTASSLFSMMKKVFYKNIGTKLAAAVLKPGIKTVKAKMDYSEYGGAPLLGIDGVVFKAHGSSDAVTIKNCIGAARAYVAAGINDKIKSLIEASQPTEEKEEQE
ncbi:MAG: phosphate acyltransferase PlsX [Clostridia bacterium]|nr:phosphate acyltransferase PlsX [Clostridia bacterium]